MSDSPYLDIQADLVPGFTELLGHDAKCGTSDTGVFFAVGDREIRDLLDRYRRNGGFGSLSPRQWLEALGVDPQRLDALKAD
ncbi:hypothetical protein ACLESO_02265 [Pyxidicoccus sp. 3LG]